MNRLIGFSNVVYTVLSEMIIQRCVVHQITSSLRYNFWENRKAFVQNIKLIYQAPNRESGESNLHRLEDK